MSWSLGRLLGQNRVAPNGSPQVPRSGPTRSNNPAAEDITNRCLRRNPEVIAQKAENETVLFCMSSGEYYSLNEMGSRVWEMFDGARTAAAIIAQLEGEYDVSHATLSEDVLFLTSELSGSGLLLDTGGEKSEG